MNSFFRWSATLGLVGSIFLGSFLATTARVLALTEQQVIERLRPVPVFAIATENGAPLVAKPEGQENVSVATVFVSQSDAQSFLSDLQSRDPEVAQGVQVIPVSLAQVYQLALDSRDQEERLLFDIVPVQAQVQSAQTLLQQSGQNAEGFDGVPLFIAQSTEGEGGYLTIQQNEQEVIPMFFEQEQLQAMVARLRQEQPGLADSIRIQVIELEGLITNLENSDNEALTQIELIPPRETLDLIRSLRQQQPGQQPAQ